MKKLFLFILTAISLSSCSNDDSGGYDDSRTIRYQVDGNYTGTMSTSYTTNSGGAGIEEFSALPWSMLILFEKQVPSAVMAVSGSGGVQGQTLTVEVYQNDELISTHEGTATSNGSILIGTSPIVF